MDYSGEMESERLLLFTCEKLIFQRSSFGNKTEFAKSVIQTLFGRGSIDLFKIRNNQELSERFSSLLGFDSATFSVLYHL
jgi:hypothetical protein